MEFYLCVYGLFAAISSENGIKMKKMTASGNDSKYHFCQSVMCIELVCTQAKNKVEIIFHTISLKFIELIIQFESSPFGKSSQKSSTCIKAERATIRKFPKL